MSYENWKAWTSHEQSPEEPSFAAETPLFSDVEFYGDHLELGPYRVFNTRPLNDANQLCPALVLRHSHFIESGGPPPSGVGNYHGGDLADELAALLSLCFGVRLRCGGTSRRFPIGGDPLGEPTATRMFQNPTLGSPAADAPIIPDALADRQIELAAQLRKFCLVSESAASVLVKSARLFQEGIWLAESVPNLSWVLFVSAIENAANHWSTDDGPPVERLKLFHGALYDILDSAGGGSLLGQVADYLVPYMGATRKFVTFCLEFMPPEPPVRPDAEARHDWSKSALKRSLRTIYKWRSQALHAGTPFPLPMCLHAPESGDAWAEVWFSSGKFGSLGGSWTPDDAPMLLRTFEYITRNALLAWWNKLVEPVPGTSQPAAL